MVDGVQLTLALTKIYCAEQLGRCERVCGQAQVQQTQHRRLL